MKIENMELLKECCRKATLKHFGSFIKEEEKKDVPALSKKAVKIKNKIERGGFDCRTDAILDIFSEIIGEDIRRSGNTKIDVDNSILRYDPLPGVLFLLTANPNSHDYALGTPILKSEGTKGICADGSEGNSLPNTKCYCPPTEEEFNEFFEQLNDANDEDNVDEDLPVERIIEENR